MSSRPFPNYLRSNRKRVALSQTDIARLIGAESLEKVCRHERFLRVPDLETALAYEVVYKRSFSEMFPGLYQKIEQEVTMRAKTLAEAESGCKRDTFLDIAGL
jgi:transcriptional regulator with XRE-family HTH domain